MNTESDHTPTSHPRQTYDWPASGHWDTLTKTEKTKLANRLIKQSDQQREPKYRFDLTGAQERARTLKRLAEVS